MNTNSNYYFLYVGQNPQIFQHAGFMSFWNNQIQNRVEIPGMQGGYLFQTNLDLKGIYSLFQGDTGLSQSILLLPIDSQAVSSLTTGQIPVPSYLTPLLQGNVSQAA